MPEQRSTHRKTTTAAPAENPMDEAEARYCSIFDQTRDGLVIHDLDTGEVVEANAAFCAMHGYDCGEMIGAVAHWLKLRYPRLQVGTSWSHTSSQSAA